VATAGGNWTARISSALCRASRWLSAASLVLVLCAFAIAASGARAGAFALAALGLVVALGAVQIYLAVRIEFDRAIFEEAAGRADGFAGFDEARHRLGWTRGAAGDRPPQARAAGLGALVKWSGWLLGAQFALALAALWLSQ
jgi:hypothetical protein